MRRVRAWPLPRRSCAAVRSATTTGARAAAERARSKGKITPSHGMEKLARVQDEIDEATDVMRQNIEQVVGRGEHLELLVDKSDAFSSNARAFQKESGTLRRAMWWKNVRMMIALSCILFSVLMVVLMGKCGWMFSKCRGQNTAP